MESKPEWILSASPPEEEEGTFFLFFSELLLQFPERKNLSRYPIRKMMMIRQGRIQKM